MLLLLLLAAGLVVARVSMEGGTGEKNATFVPLEQETGSNAKYTASGYIPDYPGYISK